MLINILVYLYIFYIGCFLGSFYNVIGLRSESTKNINSSSCCPNCNNRIKGIYLMPIIGYFISLGKCKNCKVKISVMYLLVEIIVGFLFMASYIRFGTTLQLAQSLIAISLLTITCVSDIKYKIVPDSIIIIFIVIGLSKALLNGFLFYISGGIFGFIILYLLLLVGKFFSKKDVIGGGDIKLYGVLGLLLGIKLVALSFFLSAFYATMLGWTIKKDKDGYIPFVPFIAMGAITSLFFGNYLIDSYLKIIGM